MHLQAIALLLKLIIPGSIILSDTCGSSFIPEQPFVSLAQSQCVVKYGDSSIYPSLQTAVLT